MATSPVEGLAKSWDAGPVATVISESEMLSARHPLRAKVRF
jgi:hypothetical protein